MAILRGNKWYCTICDKEYTQAIGATTCERNHDVIYIPFYRGDIYKLWNFIMTGDHSLLSGTLMDTLLKYKDKIVGVSNEEEMF